MSHLFAYASVDSKSIYEFEKLKPFWYLNPKGFFLFHQVINKTIKINNKIKNKQTKTEIL